ncbi:glycoside hydrolase family 2 protein [Lederbergia citri]|uniref:Beta-galactosidase n=1 Tax=Lederbergia citri TaxID=2833580 RepID=A0A942YJN6_9BACI|nr:sugar-binding domain-containing protein [Lederbergia citri]MBS4197750.1 hypothetical protein [Lederbergia citri]
MHSQSLKESKTLINLNTEWKFKLDPNDQLKLFQDNNADILEGTILPTKSWEEQGYGSKSSHQPIGTWKKDREYEGAAWYIKEIQIPQDLANQNIFLVLKGVRWLTELWIDGVFVGNGESLSVPHRFDITSYVHAGQKHRFVIRVDNRMKFFLHESHIHSYHTATNWGGITGGIYLESEMPFSISDIKIYPDIAEKCVKFQVTVSREGCNDLSNWTLTANVIHNGNIEATEIVEVPDRVEGSVINQSFAVQLEDAKLWSPEYTYLYDVELELKHNNEQYDLKKITFGFREIRTEGKHILLNEKPIFLTGYVDCCIFPQTGYPVWDIEFYKKQFKIVKSYGFNHVRLHGWTPPEPFWEAADQEGMLVQTELPHWSQEFLIRKKEANQETSEFLKRELKRIIQALHKHPSFMMLSMGNELISVEGHNQLNEFVRLARELDSSRIYTDNTGFGELPAHDREGDYYIPTLNWHPPYDIAFSALPDTTLDYDEVTRLEDKPLIAHEHGQFTMYVRPEESDKYKGILKPHWLEYINETLKAKKLDERLNEFNEATAIHLVRSLKETMEKARRTKGLSGIQLLDIRDFPGQGHATVGILDVFWDSKDIIQPKDFRQFNDQTVLLMRAKKRTFFNGEELSADLEVSHFGEAASSAKLTWKLEEEGNIVGERKQNIIDIPAGGLFELSKVRVKIRDGKARKLTLKASIELNGNIFTNEWDFWTFPRLTLPKNPERIWTNIETLRSILYGARIEGTVGINHLSYKEENELDLVITDQLSRDVLQYLVDGGSVWLMAKEGRQHDEVQTRYLPIFWNYVWFPQQTGTTMGLIIHDHPSMNHFPHDRFSDWQWFHLVDNTAALGMDLIPQVKPIVEVIDNFNRAKSLAYAYEVKVGRGKLFVTSFNLNEKQKMKSPEAHNLFFQLLNYLNSNDFSPDVEITIGELLRIFKVRSLFRV